MGYEILSVRESCNIFGVPQRIWHVVADGEHYVASYLERATDTGRAECMVFAADEDGDVTSWRDLAVSHKDDPYEAFCECMRDLLEVG